MNLLFNKSTESPSGVPLVHHRIVRAELSTDLDSLHIHITSWPSEQARLDGAEAAWMWMVAAPVESLDLSAGLLMGIAAAALASEYFQGGTLVPDLGETLDGAKLRKRSDVKAMRDVHEFGQFDYLGNPFDGDEAAQRRITSATAFAMLGRLQWLQEAVQALAQDRGLILPAGPEFEQLWTLANNESLPLDEQAMYGVAGALAYQVGAAHATARELLLQVDQAEDVEALAAITWPEQAA